MSMICKFIVNSKVFEILTLLIIVFNSSSYSLRNNQSNHYDGYVYILQWAEDYFLFYYSAEMILKILAFGFFNDKDSYFRDGWNILDFSVIIGLYLSYTNVRDLNLSLLRLLRLLRPLKTSSAFKGLRIILYSLFSSLPFLFISFLVLNLFYSIFAIAGLQVFAGVLKQRCFNPITGISDRIDDVCGNIVCIKGYICGQMMNNPYNNIINFDNLYSSYLMTLLTVTLDNWTTIMYFVLKAYSNYVWVYHVSLAILGNYFLLNLLLAVIKAKFTESHQYLSEEIQEDKNHEKSQKYTDLYEIKKEGLWKGRQSLQKIKVERIRKNFKLKKYSHFIFFHLENFKGWLKCFVNMLKFYLFDNFLSKIRVTPKSQPKNKKSEDFQAKHNEFSLDLRSKKKSTLAILNKYTTKILSYFIINDKNIIQKKNSKIDKETNPKYLKLKVNNKKEYEDVNYQDVLEITLKKRIIAEQKNLDSIKKEQKLFFSLKKNKNNFLDILRDLNKKNQNAIRAYDHNSDTEKFLRPFLKKSTIRSFLKKNQMANEMTKIDKKQINSKDFVAIMKEKSNLALVPSSRVRNMVFNKLKILTKIDDHQAYVLTFKSSPSSFSRLSKSITQTHSILGKSGSKIFGSSINSLRISGLVSIFNRIKNRNFKPNEEEYIFIKAMINAEIDIDDLAEKEKFVEESMNFHQKYLKLMV